MDPLSSAMPPAIGSTDTLPQEEQSSCARFELAGRSFLVVPEASLEEVRNEEASTTQDRSEQGPNQEEIAEFWIGKIRYVVLSCECEDTSTCRSKEAAVADRLTPRELQIAILVANGNYNKQIADHIHISEWTVSSHLRRIYAKLGVRTRAAMVARVVRDIR
jgi:DNA-binding CsgD family transcriptional regulator